MITDTYYLYCDDRECVSCSKRSFRNFKALPPAELREHYQKSVSKKGVALPLKNIVLRDTGTCADPCCVYCQGYDYSDLGFPAQKEISRKKAEHLRFIKDFIRQEKIDNFFLSAKLKEEHVIIDYVYVNKTKMLLSYKDSVYRALPITDFV